MNVFYRVSPYLSTHPNPLGTDKLEIVRQCWLSFGQANDIDADITIISNLPFTELHPFTGYDIIQAQTGNIETFHKQLDEIVKLPDETKVLLAEDDYLWQPSTLSVIDEALDVLDIVFPYDHPGHYTEQRFKDQPKRIRLVGNQTYRDAPSNTLTFGCKAKLIKRHIELIKTFGVRDHELFQALPEDKWCAIPALATHLVQGLLSPNRKWL
jgi:hypothetical protein